MKKLTLLALALSLAACNQSGDSAGMKTAYVDTAKIIEEYTEAKDIEAKYKNKAQEMGKELEVEVAKFRSEASNFSKNAREKGEAWAQQKGAELTRREQELGYAQQAMLQQLQKENAVEMDSMIKGIKATIKTYGKEKGYDYIYGTGDAASVLYAKDQYDITQDVIKLLNEKYKSKPAEKADEKAADEAKK
jgi:outer membrane protein